MKSCLTLIFLLSTCLISAKPMIVPPGSVEKAACDIDLGPDVTVCQNGKIFLNPKPLPVGEYAWTGSPGLNCYDCPSPVFSSASTGVFILVATVTTPDCSMSDTIRIDVINGEAPEYQIIDNQGICSGDSIALGGGAFPGTFYNWFSNPPGFVNNTSNPKVKPVGPTKYYLSVSNLSCPLITLDSVVITPVSLGLQVTPTDTVQLCQGQFRTFQATVTPAGNTVFWTPATGLQVGPGGATATASPQESTLYTASVTLGGCTRTRKIFVAVDSLPDDLDLRPADTTICQGARVVLVSPIYEPVEYPKITFKWAPVAGTLTPDSLFNMVVEPSQTTIYRRITRNGVCVDTAYSAVHVIPPAEMTVVPADTTVCPGRSVAFALTYTPGVTDIKWEPANGLTCSDCDNPVATPGTTQTYSVSGKFQGCPVGTSAIVRLFPLAPIQFPADRQLCVGESVVLNELFDPGASYVWTSTHPGFGTKTIPNPGFTPTQTATYFVTADNGCIRRDSVKITVHSATLSAEGDTSICKNFSAPLTASVSIPGTSFQWVNVQTGQVVSTMQSATVMPGQTTSYAAVFTFGDNCKLTDTVTVTINGEAPAVTFPGDQQICPGESVVLNTAAPVSGAVYAWTASPPDPTLQPNAPAPQVSPTVNTTYSVMATLGNCSIARQVSITAHTATLSVSPDTTVCDNTQAMLKAVGSASNGVYLWSNGSKNAEISVTPTVNTTYTVTYTYGDGCVLQDSVMVFRVPNFSLSIESFPIKDTVNVGEPLALTAIVQSNPPQNLSNFTFMWQEMTVDTKDLPFTGQSIDVIPSSNDTSANEITYKLIATSPNGCVNVAQKKFYLIFPKVAFPNAFTPNGDGTNDVFEMVVYKGVAYISQMRIFNRWGQKVYESTEPDAVWDGMVDGKEAPVDVYVYFVWWRRGDDALQVQATGEISLLR